MTPTCSVAMATYNGERYLRAQLDSISAQTRPPVELVICDDGSTDSTIDIAESFAREAPFEVHIYRNERTLGYGSNFLKAAQLCREDWVAFSDQDDVWLPRKLESVFEAAARHDGVVMVSHTTNIVDEELRPTGLHHPPHTATQLVDQYRYTLFPTLAGMSLVFDRRLLVGFDPARRPSGIAWRDQLIPHDQTVPILAGSAGRILVLNEALSLYRRHSNATTAYHKHRASRSLKVRIGTAVQTGAQIYIDRMKTAREVGVWLGELAPNADGAFRGAFADGARYYARAADLYEARGQVYSAPTLHRRVAALLTLLKIGGYAPARPLNPFKPASLLKDIAAAARPVFQ